MTSEKNRTTDFQLIFPEHGEDNFGKRLANLPEYQLYYKEPLPPIRSTEEFERYVQNACTGFEKTLYQHFVQHYLSRRSPYKSLLLFHGLGSGKTCSAITIAESLLLDHSQKEEPRILVISPAALQASFEEQIFAYTRYLDYGEESLKNQCTEDIYRRLIYGTKDRTIIKKRIHALIHSRYQFITYEGLVKYIEKHNGAPIENKTIIVDEAHNLRQNETEKAAAEALVKLIEKGKQNRLVLLSATPMYNEPNEIFWLLSLLIKNDKRTDIINMQNKKLFKVNSIQDPQSFELLKVLSNEYISYIKGSNPFTFPIRFSPSVNNTALITDSWAKDIRDGLVPTLIGTEQQGILHESTKAGGKEIKNLQVLLELTNITYPQNSHGEDGFKKIFRRLERDQLSVEYIPGKEKSLLPTPERIGKIASKILRICDFIRSSEGVVVLYSQFVWAGIIPCAIALEHMGFQRYISTSSVQPLLQMTPLQLKDSEVKNVAKVKYEGIINPTYAILSGDVSVMGSSKINDILDKVNNKNNMNGQKIKVVLMTPIAAEGLNFKNIREIHVLDPWYHMNRLEQVIGRTIRTCSHSGLPLEKRNVTVYLHTTVSSTKTNDTADMYDYKISARKLFEMQKAEEVIRNASLDCSLMLNINYYPKEIFQFTSQMQTSQGKTITYAYGDSIDDKPKCINIQEQTSNKNLIIRSDVYQNILPTLISKIINYISKTKAEYISFEDLQKILQVNKTIAFSTIQYIIYPAHIIPNYRIYPYVHGIRIEKELEKITQTEIKLPSSEGALKTKDVQPECNIDLLLSKANNPSEDFFVATYKLYTDIDSLCWPILAKRCIETRSPIIDRFAEYLAKTGALVKTNELSRIIYTPGFKYGGYVNIFNTTQFEVIIYDPKAKSYRNATELEIRQIKSGRIEYQKPTKTIYGMLFPRNKKNSNEPLRNELKIISAGSQPGKGAECSTKKWNEINELLESFKIKKPESSVKSGICITLGIEMFRKGALLLYPEWKPT
jgi:DNA polymerase III delta prime subunit